MMRFLKNCFYAILSMLLLSSAALADWDFGDAPELPYFTTMAYDGARHWITPGFQMGAIVDAEPDGQPSPDAQGDDMNVWDDEDGVTFLDDFILGSTARIIVNASQQGVLNAWIDWGMDGSWMDPGDWVFVDQFLSPGDNMLTLTVPPVAP